MSDRTCSKCGATGPNVEFYRGNVCKLCHNERMRIYRAANPERIQAIQRRNYEKYREKRVADAVAYAKLNPPDPERRKARSRERYAKRRASGSPCTIEGCDRPRKNKTNPLCDGHDRRRREIGIIGGPLRDRQTIETGSLCASARCNEPYHAKGLCRRHYRSLRHRKNPEESNAATRRRRALRRALPAEPYALADIIERDGSSCVLCGEEIDLDLAWPHRRSLTVEHLECLSWTGSAGDVLSNVAVSHLTCNLGRSDRPHPAAARKRAELLAAESRSA